MWFSRKELGFLDSWLIYGLSLIIVGPTSLKVEQSCVYGIRPRDRRATEGGEMLLLQSN